MRQEVRDRGATLMHDNRALAGVKKAKGKARTEETKATGERSTQNTAHATREDNTGHAHRCRQNVLDENHM